VLEVASPSASWLIFVAARFPFFRVNFGELCRKAPNLRRCVLGEETADWGSAKLRETCPLDASWC
jgi:hypothetical protein